MQLGHQPIESFCRGARGAFEELGDEFLHSLLHLRRYVSFSHLAAQVFDEAKICGIGCDFQKDIRLGNPPIRFIIRLHKIALDTHPLGSGRVLSDSRAFPKGTKRILLPSLVDQQLNPCDDRLELCFQILHWVIVSELETGHLLIQTQPRILLSILPICLWAPASPAEASKVSPSLIVDRHRGSPHACRSPPG